MGSGRVCDLLAPFFRTWLAVVLVRTGPMGHKLIGESRGRGCGPKGGMWLWQGPLHIHPQVPRSGPPETAGRLASPRDGGGAVVTVVDSSADCFRSRAD